MGFNIGGESIMDDTVFAMYEKVCSMLNEDERTTFKLGFTLGISEGIARCTKKLRDSNEHIRDNPKDTA